MKLDTEQDWYSQEWQLVRKDMDVKEHERLIPTLNFCRH